MRAPWGRRRALRPGEFGRGLGEKGRRREKNAQRSTGEAQGSAMASPSGSDHDRPGRQLNQDRLEDSVCWRRSDVEWCLAVSPSTSPPRFRDCSRSSPPGSLDRGGVNSFLYLR